MVLTFFPHPRLVVASENEVKLLNTIDERTELLEKKNINHFVIHPFDQEFANLTPEEFVKKILVYLVLKCWRWVWVAQVLSLNLLFLVVRLILVYRLNTQYKRL